jgi:alkanesulfonate monooxygenase SsuD/methylene tetrahydromethanopterin reductase-like flavin-dependent oxidoreductase (luciferase family)
VRGRIPILVGGEGERITLRIAAQHADIWNAPSPPETFEHKNKVLDQWCEKIRRNPDEIERSVLTMGHSDAKLDKYLAAGAEHIIIHLMDPWKFSAVEKLVRWQAKALSG